VNRFPCLLADIGGTNVRFAILRSAENGPEDLASLRCAQFPGVGEAARNYLSNIGLAVGSVRRAAFAVAGAVDVGTIAITNHPWTFTRESLVAALGLHELVVVNDFAALAYALPALTASDLHSLGTPRPRTVAPVAVLGPGTGLGVAGLIPVGRHWYAVPGEGGHATLAAADEFEAEVLGAARRQFAHVSAERLLSGIGLPILLRAVCTVLGESPTADYSAEQVSELGISRGDEHCHKVMQLFFSFLGGFAGNVALTLGARGGVLIGGGIVPKMVAFAEQTLFRRRFEEKGRFCAYLQEISTSIITIEHAAMRGLAGIMENRITA
jgi:glucokinase